MVRHDVQPHRKAGVCIAIVGFLPLFAGIMMIAVANTAQNKTDPKVKAVGPTCLVVGILLVIGGFTLQFIKHKLWKARQTQEKTTDKKYIYTTSSRPSSRASSCSSRGLARSSIEEPFDDINEICPVEITTEVEDIRPTTPPTKGVLSSVNELKVTKVDINPDVTPNKKPSRYSSQNKSKKKEIDTKIELRKVRTIEDELKEIQENENSIGVVEKCSNTALPGSMFNLHDSD